MYQAAHVLMVVDVHCFEGGLITSGSLHQLIPRGMVRSSKEDVGSLHSQDLLDESSWYSVKFCKSLLYQDVWSRQMDAL